MKNSTEKLQNYFKAGLLLVFILFSVFIYGQTANEQPVRGITPGRGKAVCIAIIALISLIVGWRTMLRSKNDPNNNKNGALIAISLGILSIVLGIVHFYTNAGAVFGSGSGKAGALVAMVLGSSGSILAAIALSRHNRKPNKTN